MIDLPLTRYPHDLLLARVRELRGSFTAYGALAQALGAPLVTCDRKLGSASIHHARVEVI